jgi:hypothetical protein
VTRRQEPDRLSGVPPGLGLPLFDAARARSIGVGRGPRPEDPGFVAERSHDYEQILSVRPGITGLSQIAFAEESAILSKDDPLTHYRERIFPQKIRLDRMYAARPTLAMDFQIIFWTAAAVMLRRQVAVHRGTGKMNLRRR